MATSSNAAGIDDPCIQLQQSQTTPAAADAAAACSASHSALDALVCEISAMSLSPLEAAIQAKEKELALLKQQLQVQRSTPTPEHELRPASGQRLGQDVCFGCVIFLPNPRTFHPSQAKWHDGKRSLFVPHIMLVLDYCTGELKTAGGRSNFGESALDCMNREFIEETGYDNPICCFRDEDLRHREQIRQTTVYGYVKYATFEVEHIASAATTIRVQHCTRSASHSASAFARSPRNSTAIPFAILNPPSLASRTS